jgi:hypothetical protein
MNSCSRMVRTTIVAMLVVPAAVNAQAPGNAPNSASADCADLPALATKLERADKILHDWPNLARYEEANAGVPAPAKFDARATPSLTRGSARNTVAFSQVSRTLTAESAARPRLRC